MLSRENYYIKTLNEGLRDISEYNVHNLLADNYLFEEEHISTIFDDCAKSVMYRCVQIINEIHTDSLTSSDVIKKYNPLYTGFNFISKKPNSDEPRVDKLNDEDAEHPIYVNFTRSANLQNTLAGTPNRPKIVSLKKIAKSIKVDFSNDDVVILINIDLMSQYSLSEYNVMYLHSVLAHEMHHAMEMFAFWNSNTITHLKNSLFKKFTSDTTHQRLISSTLSSSTFNFIKNLLYWLSRPECRARLNQFNTFLNDLALSKTSFNNILTVAKRDLVTLETIHNGTHLSSKEIHNSLVTSVLRSPLVGNIILLQKMKSAVDDVLYDKVQDTTILIIGYYLFQCKLLHFDYNDKHYFYNGIDITYFKTVFNSESISRLLSDKHYLEQLKSDERYETLIYIIKHAIESEYLIYEKYIYNNTDKHLDDLFSEIEDIVIEHCKYDSLCKLEMKDIDIAEFQKYIKTVSDSQLNKDLGDY